MNRYKLLFIPVVFFALLICVNITFAQFSTQAAAFNNTFATAQSFVSPTPSPTIAPSPTASPTPSISPVPSPSPTATPTPTSVPGCGGNINTNISGNGAGSTNSVNVTQNCSTNVNQSNTTVINNAVNSSSNTGGNSASNNTSGLSVIYTGSSTSTVTIENIINANYISNP